MVDSGDEGRGPHMVELFRRAALRGMVLGLDNMRGALRALGEPHLAVPCVHVTGSNGKGSVCAMVEAIGRAGGLRTGLYSSPHLCRVAELVRIDGEPLEQGALEELAGEVLEAGPGLTFFEVMTGVAFLAFRRAQVDLAVIEVGMGGAGDATNVVEAPLATAITTVAHEHARFLGDTIEAIARTKAGILKRGSPVVVGPLPPEADQAVSEVAVEVGAGPVWRVAPGGGAIRMPGVIQVAGLGGGASVEIVPPAGTPFAAVRARPGLSGPHQQRNAGVAAGIAWCLARRWPRLAEAIEVGLAGVRWPGRMERIPVGGISVILDCAHNPEGIGALAAALVAEGIDPRRTVLVFGALADKSWRAMLETIAPLARKRLYTLPKGRPPAALADLQGVAEGEAIASVREAVDAAVAAAGEGGTVLVTGSIYLAGEARGLLLGIPCDPVVAY